MASNLNPDSLKLLVFYQGTKAKQYVDHIKSFVTTGVSVGIRIDPQVVEDSDSSIKETIYDKLRSKIEESDVALAVLTPDDRWASEAGSLWLEIGHWLGSKRRACPDNGEEYLSSIMLLKQQKPAGHRTRWRVEMVTNLGTGIPAPCFRSDAELDREVLGFLLNAAHKRSHGQSLLSHEKRVLDTLGCSVNPSWSDQMDICEGNAGRRCEFRAAALTFIAELLRMGRSNREHVEIESALFVIGTRCQEILLTDELWERGHFNRHRSRQDKMNDLYEEVHRLRNVAVDLLDRSASYGGRPDSS